MHLTRTIRKFEYLPTRVPKQLLSTQITIVFLVIAGTTTNYI